MARDLEKNSYQNVPQSICLSALQEQAGQHKLIGAQLQLAVVVKEAVVGKGNFDTPLQVVSVTVTKTMIMNVADLAQRHCHGHCNGHEHGHGSGNAYRKAKGKA
jgi:hypothetical protein